MTFIFPYIGNVIIPIDELLFFRGVGVPPTIQWIQWIQPHHSKDMVNESVRANIGSCSGLVWKPDAKPPELRDDAWMIWMGDLHNGVTIGFQRKLRKFTMIYHGCYPLVLLWFDRDDHGIMLGD